MTGCLARLSASVYDTLQCYSMFVSHSQSKCRSIELAYIDTSRNEFCREFCVITATTTLLDTAAVAHV